MSNVFRKIKRNNLKNHLNTNKINEFYHSEYDTLEKKMRKVKKGNENGKVK